jgi:peptidoglycan/LPS O-acetylase OafA/YrhL
METKRLKALDGIRGIAAVIVAFIWHYQHFSPETYPFSKALYWPYHFGWIMVDLFFILSGFIFFNVYRNKVSSHSLSFKDFSILRFSRLYPLHWLMLIVVLAVQVFRKLNGLPSFPSHYSRNIVYFLLNIPMLQNGWLTTAFSYNAPAWSISIEIMMYLLFFAVFYNTNETKKHMLYCLLLIYLGIIITFSGDDKAFFNGQVSRGLIGFFIGCITGEIYEYCGKNKKQGAVFSAFCSVAVLLLITVPAIFGYEVLQNWAIVYTFCFFPAFIFVVLRVKILSAVFSIKPLVYLGNLSYGIYLLHYPLQLVTKTIDEYCNLGINYSSKIFFIGFSLATIIISHFIYCYYEMPVQNYIRGKYISKNSGHST